MFQKDQKKKQERQGNSYHGAKRESTRFFFSFFLYYLLLSVKSLHVICCQSEPITGMTTLKKEKLILTSFFSEREKSLLCVDTKGHFCRVSVCKDVWMNPPPSHSVPSNQRSPLFSFPRLSMCSANHKKGFFFVVRVVYNLFFCRHVHCPPQWWRCVNTHRKNIQTRPCVGFLHQRREISR